MKRGQLSNLKAAFGAAFLLALAACGGMPDAPKLAFEGTPHNIWRPIVPVQLSRNPPGIPYVAPGPDNNVLTATGGKWVSGAAVATGTIASGSIGQQAYYSGTVIVSPYTMGGDCTFSLPNINCTKTNGSLFAASATVDTTSASNITSGSLALSRIAAIASNTALGSIAGGAPIALTKTQLTTLINSFSSTLSGAVPATGGVDNTHFLAADGTWLVPPGGGGSLTVTDGTHSVSSTTSLTFGGCFLVSGSAGSATVNGIAQDLTKTANYSVAAGDMCNALTLAATSGTPALTLPAASSTIFAHGMTLSISVPKITSGVNWTVTNSTGLTMRGLNSTTLLPGTQGTFVANADGATLDFFPGAQVATTTALGSVIPDNSTITISNGVITATAGGTGCTISGAAGIVLNNGSNACTTDTNITASAGALSLGASGTLGSLVLGNATSGTLTLQPAAGAITGTVLIPSGSDTLVNLTGTQTLSNKTLVAPALGTPASGVLTNATGLPAASVVAGALANGMTATTQTPGDNSTKIATTAFVAAAGGGGGAVALVSTLTASNSATLAWTGLAGGDYKIVCRNLISAAGTTSPIVQVGEGGGPTWETSGYNVGLNVFPSAGSASLTNQPGFYFSSNTISGGTIGTSGYVDLYQLSSTVVHTAVGSGGTFTASSTYSQLSMFGNYATDTNAITAVRVLFASGNITSGTCSLYSVAS